MAAGEMVSGFYTYKPTDISTTVSEAIKQFEGMGFQCTVSNSDNIICEKFDNNGQIVQRITLLTSMVGEQTMIEKVQVTNYL